ncbi:MAG: C4-dicarboxylate transporter DcuC [Bacteroidia bacterium]|nr:C4-dicarboxylate transporter DcuC [Bacteroidia bacterium]MCF8427671.1 C4-dicarboxylate transporter DcuC [Bacteroidia bacterium]MCF8447081.1 C4-dicarboxylate transporter DcuC [Bacteroidia bacterium]
MLYTGLVISIVFIAIVAKLLVNKFFPQAVLLLAGIAMLLISGIINSSSSIETNGSGVLVFDIFEYIKNSFSKTNANVGLMIMAIGGFVAYMDKIGASEALVRVAIRPLAFLKKHPNLTAVAVIPIGQMIFICVPSAAGFGLLLMASVFPILVNLGVSRLAAVSIITGCTSFCIGPASVITASAVQIAGIETVPYFINSQIPIAILLNVVLMVSYFFVNKHYEAKDKLNEVLKKSNEEVSTNAPAIYAILPVLPLVLLLTFSGVFEIFPIKLKIETTTAMLFSLFVGMAFELIRTRNIKEVFSSFKVFIDGMGEIFKSVVTLIIVAEIFANGLIALGFMEGLVSISQGFGMGAIGIGIVMTIMIFLAAILMGSGNAAFFAFGPLIPNVAAKFGVASTSILLPMNLAASMGRSLSPIAGVLIATAEVAGVPVIDIVKRNMIPVSLVLLTLLIYHFGLCF